MTSTQAMDPTENTRSCLCYGKLTQSTIKKLQAYYTKATKSNSIVEAMSDAVQDSFLHCMSTDADPHHARCPKG